MQMKKVLEEKCGPTFTNYFERLNLFTKSSKLNYTVPGSNEPVKIRFKFVKVTFKSAEYAKVFHKLPVWKEFEIAGAIGMCIKDN